jgi:hypothetical protein
MCDLKIQSLLACVEKGFPHTSMPEGVQWNLLQKAASHTAQHLEHQLQEGHITAAYADSAKQKLACAQAQIEKRKRPSEPIALSLPTYKMPQNDQVLFRRIQMPQQTQSLANPGSISQSSIHVLQAFRKCISDKYHILHWEQCVQLAAQHQRTEGLAIHQALYEFLRPLPLELGGISPDDARKLLLLAGRLGTFYFLSGAPLLANQTILFLKRMFRKMLLAAGIVPHIRI